MVRQLEKAQLEIAPVTMEPVENYPETDFSHNSSSAKSPSIPLRTSTPTFIDENTETPTSLSQLESAISVATTSQTGFSELLPASSPDLEATITPQLQVDEYNASSVCELSSLPRVEPKLHFLTDFSESDKTVEEYSLVECPSLYGNIPVGSESEIDTNGESYLYSQSVGRYKPSTSAIKRTDDNLPELLGRSRAILKLVLMGLSTLTCRKDTRLCHSPSRRCIIC